MMGKFDIKLKAALLYKGAILQFRGKLYKTIIVHSSVYQCPLKGICGKGNDIDKICETLEKDFANRFDYAFKEYEGVLPPRDIVIVSAHQEGEITECHLEKPNVL